MPFYFIISQSLRFVKYNPKRKPHALYRRVGGTMRGRMLAVKDAVTAVDGGIFTEEGRARFGEGLTEGGKGVMPSVLVVGECAVFHFGKDEIGFGIVVRMLHDAPLPRRACFSIILIRISVLVGGIGGVFGDGGEGSKAEPPSEHDRIGTRKMPRLEKRFILEDEDFVIVRMSDKRSFYLFFAYESAKVMAIVYIMAGDIGFFYIAVGEEFCTFLIKLIGDIASEGLKPIVSLARKGVTDDVGNITRKQNIIIFVAKEVIKEIGRKAVVAGIGIKDGNACIFTK